MLLPRELGIRVGEAPSPPAISWRKPVKLAPWVLDLQANSGCPEGLVGGVEGDHRICSAAGDVSTRMNGGERRDSVGQIGGFSHDSEHDLAAMVRDFLENGSSGGQSRYSSDSDSGFSDLAHLAERVLFHKHTMTKYESDLQSVVHNLIFAINEVDLYLVKEDQCNASCIRQTLVKLLKLSGYEAAVCSSRWQGFDRVPGGDHEYIDVVLTDIEGSERFIIDIDFCSHFEIARAATFYNAILNSLPIVYVGSLSRLKEFLQIMVDAARLSLKQNSMPLPPWRSLAYLQAKWSSKYEKCSDYKRNQHICGCDHRQCIGHLQRLKASLKLDIESEQFQEPVVANRKWMFKSDRRSFSLPSLLTESY